MKIMLLTFLICLLIMIILLISMKSSSDKEKLSSFECGFDPYMTPRTPFSIRFFKILLIFLLFDVEIVMILPTPFNMCQSMNINIFIHILIILILFGLYFEWKEGSLEWM